MDEQWREVPGFPRYAVSDLGRVVSLLGRGNKKRATPLLLAAQAHGPPGKTHYLTVWLTRESGGGTHARRIHILVLQAFVGPRPPGHEALHVNGQSLDNRLENLRWGTKSENAQDKFRHGTGRDGVNAVNTKLTESEVRQARHLASVGKLNAAQFARETGVCTPTVRNAVIGKTWRHLA